MSPAAMKHGPDVAEMLAKAEAEGREVEGEGLK
jgi:hypothetical protein